MMNIRIRHYDKILLLNLEDLVVEQDLVRLAAFVNSVAAKVAYVVADVGLAVMQPPVAATLFRLKRQYEHNRLPFAIVSPGIQNADFDTMTEAVAEIGGSEATRVLEILALDAELQRVNAELGRVNDELAAKLGLRGDPAHAPGGEIEPALAALADLNRQLFLQFKTLSGGINESGGAGEASRIEDRDGAGAEKVAQAKHRALDTVRGSGVLD